MLMLMCPRLTILPMSAVLRSNFFSGLLSAMARILLGRPAIRASVAQASHGLRGAVQGVGLLQRNVCKIRVCVASGPFPPIALSSDDRRGARESVPPGPGARGQA